MPYHNMKKKKKTKKMKRRKYEHKFISFVHDPPVEDIMNNDMSFFMNRKKLDMELRIDNDNVKELEKMKILIPLTKYLEDNIKSKKKFIQKRIWTYKYSSAYGKTYQLYVDRPHVRI